jgi:uncharacterized protein YlxW (UPF0749 family)
MNRITIWLSAILFILGIISLSLKLILKLEIDWLWATAPLWLSIIIFFSTYILGEIGKDYSQINKKEEVVVKKDKEQLIKKALNEIKEAQEGKNPFNTNIDPVQKAIQILKKEKERKIEEKANKLKKSLGKDEE